MSEHTPTWDRVREHYYLGRQQFDDPLFPAGGVTEIVAEFDRWYQAEIAAAEQRGRIAGLREAAAEANKDGYNDTNHSGILDWMPSEYALQTSGWLESRADQEGDGE